MLFGIRTKTAAISMEDARRELAQDPSIHLIDVRSKEEYDGGHIPGSVNVPLDRLSDIARAVPDKDARVFVYCLSGGRSQAACGQMARMGYSDVCNIGGITRWSGPIERKR